MKSMTYEQAYGYVLAGFFPNPADIDTIVELQDIFGRLPYNFNISLLADDKTCKNAIKLFSMIWHDETVESMIKAMMSLQANNTEANILRATIERNTAKIKELTSEIEAATVKLERTEREIKLKTNLYDITNWLPGGRYSKD